MMKRTLILLYILLILTMATATVVEKFMGTDYVSSRIYGAWWFSLLWGILTALGILYIVRSRMRQWSIVALHLSFVVILAGALLTHLTSFRGTMPLRVGQTTDRYYRTDGETGMPSHQLPFRIRLDGFRVRYHAGTKAAADYESRVTVMDGNDRQPAIVSMNHIMTHRGVRFYQSSYDADMRGSTLAINSDPYGIPVTYTGYALLFFSLIALLMRRDGTFRTLLRHPLLRKGMLVSMLWLCMLGVNATTTFPKDVADRFGHLHILYQDRVCLLQTPARDFTKKLCGKASYKGCTAEQVFTGFIFWGDEWADEPLLKVKSGVFKETLQLPDYVSVNALFDRAMGGYRLAAYVEEYYRGAQDDFHRQAVELDEKVKLVMELRQAALLSIFPYTTGGRTLWYTPTEKYPAAIPAADVRYMREVFSTLYADALTGNNAHVAEVLQGLEQFQRRHAGTSLPSVWTDCAERIYNVVPFATLLFVVNLVAGLALLLFFILRLTRRPCKLYVTRWVQRVSVGVLLVSFLSLTLCLALRWIISGTIPMGNGYETMLFVAWLILLAALLCRRMEAVVIFGLILSGFFLLVSHLSLMDPAITPIMPVLHSPLLTVHVGIIMIGYALLSFTFICGLTGLFVPRHAQQLQVLSQLFLYPALAALGSGIFIGAIWANVSWGQYWSWDPKETWALITFMVYGAAVHKQSLPLLARPHAYHIYMTLAFLTILMTYFGVNYFLGGMHAYA
ncbi:MAG: cytochrome c biogenesis protein CcsA [Hoylesella marshii]|uniref:cytochrome c biogenesis protein n=1 Tax=Hoylesella marshii TaxID=189722 RepID=UPI003FA0176D